MTDLYKQNTKLSNLQAEILKLFALNIGEEDLLQIKNIIGQYLSNKATELIDAECEKRNYSNEIINSWIFEQS